jgi:hypothetical protein
VVSRNRIHAGLGNRMRVLLGAQSLAEREGRGFGYVWQTGRPFGARLTDLWLFDAPRVPVVVSQALALRYPYRGADLAWLDDERRRERLWQIKTPHALALPPDAEPWERKLRLLTVVPELQSRVQDLFDHRLRDAPYVGVMIRAHAVSHEQTRRLSPVSWYVERMRQLEAAHPGLTFYVSCDAPDVQERVCAEVGNCVAQVDKGEYNSRRALRAAIVDLYLLASASHLLVPHYSSFPELAHKLADERPVMETSQRGVDGAVDAGAGWTVVADPLRPWVRTAP